MVSEPAVRREVEALLVEHVKSLLAAELCRTLPLQMHETVKRAIDAYARDD